jgi:type IV pilus assembly protein PilM
MLEFFGLGKKNYFLGIDFGTSALKIVELSFKNQRAHLENYGWASFGFNENKSGAMVQSYEEKLKAAAHELILKMKLKSNAAYIAMPGFSGLITLIDFPAMKKEELEQALTFEAKKYIPTPLEEVSISWDIVTKQSPSLLEKAKEREEGPQRIQVLLVAAPKREVMRYESLARGSGLEIRAIELETFSLVRSLIGDDLGCFLIIDIGANACNIILVEKGIVRVNRNIDVGGNQITNIVAENMNISRQRAEDFKRQGKDFINSRESAIVLPALESITGEAARIISAYQEKNKEARIDGVVLSGGTAGLRGITDYFTRVLGIKTIVGNPWKRVIFNEKLTSAIGKMGPSFSVALGLALRGVEEYKRN